ncbi:MAG TPA: pyridoxal-phosphate dependent enzyme, partial [Chlamydiales bacterium]|nr:pyridoxal-phosphate dependent enzyme [Chlamydiales bacterium]
MKMSFEKAKIVLQGKILKTPLVPLLGATTASGQMIFLKAENLQPSGSFKIRGATYCMSLHTKEEHARGVIAYSTGNHAKAVAMAAKLLGIQATIVMAKAAPQFKIEAVKSYGAHLVICEHVEEMRSIAEELSQKNGSYLVSPYDHLEVITGQGTIGLEIMDEMQPGAIFVPVGGGGLIAGIATAVKEKMPHVKIIGVE